MFTHLSVQRIVLSDDAGAAASPPLRGLAAQASCKLGGQQLSLHADARCYRYNCMCQGVTSLGMQHVAVPQLCRDHLQYRPVLHTAFNCNKAKPERLCLVSKGAFHHHLPMSVQDPSFETVCWRSLTTHAPFLAMHSMMTMHAQPAPWALQLVFKMPSPQPYPESWLQCAEDQCLPVAIASAKLIPA